jgi:hypothetical protein
MFKNVGHINSIPSNALIPCLEQESNADDRYIGRANVEVTASAEQRKDARDI